MKALGCVIKIVCGLLLLVVLLLGGGFLLVNNNSFQNKLLQKATTMLTEKLQTKVTIDSASIDLLTLDAKLYGLEVEDRQQRKMLSLDFLLADVDLWPLLKNNEVRISKAIIKGIKAELHHTPNDTIDTIPNYQFIIDTFKKDKKKQEVGEKKDEKDEKEKKKKKFSLAIEKVKAEDISVTYNGMGASLGKLLLSQPDSTTIMGTIEQLGTTWKRTNKKGWEVTNQAVIGKLTFLQQDGLRTVDISDLRFKRNNQHPRKNSGKPKRGFFDLEHLNLTAQLKVVIDHIGKDTVHATLKEMTARDSIMGIDLRDVHSDVAYSHQQLFFKNLVVKQINTQLNIDSAYMRLPSKKKGITLAYRTSTIKGRAFLKDIARTFAPVLSKFSIPLNLTVNMSGDDNSITFRNVRVGTDDKKLSVRANGRITNLKDKYKLNVHFDVDQMEARGDIKERIINQFPVKKFMMQQLAGLGTVHYTGSFDVLWRREEFRGNLATQVGNLNFNFALDEQNKYVLGRAATREIKIGELFNMPQIGPVAATADFKFDISKPRTAIMRRKKGGKLPIGEVQAHVDNASYKSVKVHNLTVQIVSDGAVAEGNLQAPGKWVDLSCDFTFTNTSEMQKMKIKPKMKVHDVLNTQKIKTKIQNFFKSDTPEEEKQRRKEEKELRKQQKAEEKAARKQQKAEEKARKKEEKALRKQQKAAEKAARKQQAAEE